jgi:hypothetical protein
VGRLRHHPSIVLWDSSNENDGDPPFFYDTVLTTIAESDDSRPLWPASPSSGFAVIELAFPHFMRLLDWDLPTCCVFWS